MLCDVQKSGKILTRSPLGTIAIPELGFFTETPATADALKSTMPPLPSENSVIDVVNNDEALMKANLTTRFSQASNTSVAVSIPVANELSLMNQTTTLVSANNSQAFETASATAAAPTALSTEASASSLLTSVNETSPQTNSSMTTISNTILPESVILTKELLDTSAISVLSGTNATSDPGFTSMAQQFNSSLKTFNLRSAFDETNKSSSQPANYTINTSQLTAPSLLLDTAFLRSGFRNSSMTSYEIAESRNRSSNSATKAGISSISSKSGLLSSSSIPESLSLIHI